MKHEDQGGRCTMQYCEHTRNFGGHCGVTGCPNARLTCPVHGSG